MRHFALHFNTMVVCRFFAESTCKYGSTCRNEHIRNGVVYKTAYQAGSGGGGRQGGYRGPQTGGHDRRAIATSIQEDIKEAPEWPFSAYGVPGLHNGANLIPGDISFEEVRLEFRSMPQPQHQTLMQDMQRHAQTMTARRNILVQHVDAFIQDPGALASLQAQQPVVQPLVVQPPPQQIAQPFLAPGFQQSASLSNSTSSLHSNGSQSYPLSGALRPLTEQERLAYHAPSFTPGQIPENPPPSYR